MRVAITGTAGLIGSWLADAMLAGGHVVTGIDNLCGGYASNIPVHKNYTHEFEDICDLHEINADVVYHCAALAYEGLSVFSPKLITKNIMLGSVSVMTAAINGGVHRFINCSSMARYGIGSPPFKETDIPMPIDPYGMAKLSAERQLNLIGEIHGVKVLHAVPHNVIGSRQRYDDPYRNVVGIMVNRALQRKPIIIYGDGKQERCFSFIQDVLPTLVSLADCKADHGEVFNVGPDEDPISISRLAEWVSRKTDVPIEYFPPRPREVKTAWCSADKIRQRFGYETKTALADGLEFVFVWIAKRGVLEFNYNLPIEIDSPNVPLTWKDRLL